VAFLDDLVSAVGLLSGVLSRGNSTSAILDGVEAFWADLLSSMTALTTLAAPRCDFVDRVVDLLLVEGLCSASVGDLSTSLERVALADGLFRGVDLAARGDGRRRVLLAPMISRLSSESFSLEASLATSSSTASITFSSWLTITSGVFISTSSI